MQTSISWLGAARLAVLALLFLFCCSDPVEEETLPPSEEEEEEEPIPDDADAMMKTFSFLSMTQVNGSVPTVANTSLVKTDSEDTIYVLPQVKNVLRISHPKSSPIKGIYMAVQGSTFYYDVPAYEEEDSDTVTIVVFEIDPEDLDGRYDVPVEITPYDDSSQPIDIIERTISVEDPADSGCDLLQDGDTVPDATRPLLQWHWKWTVVLGSDGQPRFINGPGREFSTLQKDIAGCCNAGCPAYVVNPTTQQGEWVFDSFVDAGTSYSILAEFFEFYRNGTFFRFTAESERNFDPLNTDWCSEVAAFRQGIDNVEYYGTHDYLSGDPDISYVTTRSVCADPLGLCGYGSRGGRVTFSCHAMMITAGVEGQSEMRFYVRNTGDGIGSPTDWND